MPMRLKDWAKEELRQSRQPTRSRHPSHDVSVEFVLATGSGYDEASTSSYWISRVQVADPRGSRLLPVDSVQRGSDIQPTLATGGPPGTPRVGPRLGSSVNLTLPTPPSTQSLRSETPLPASFDHYVREVVPEIHQALDASQMPHRSKDTLDVLEGELSDEIQDTATKQFHRSSWNASTFSLLPQDLSPDIQIGDIAQVDDPWTGEQTWVSLSCQGLRVTNRASIIPDAPSQPLAVEAQMTTASVPAIAPIPSQGRNRARMLRLRELGIKMVARIKKEYMTQQTRLQDQCLRLFGKNRSRLVQNRGKEGDEDAFKVSNRPVRLVDGSARHALRVTNP